MFLIMLIALQAAATQPHQSGTLSVCDVLTDDFTKLNGRRLSVRGLIGGTDEGIWLTGDCRSEIVAGGLRWSKHLWIEFGGQDKRAVRSWTAMLQKMRAAGADWTRDRIWATIIGPLETRGSMYDMVTQGPDGPRRAGFGHMGGAPAAMEVVEVRDVVVELRRDASEAR